MSVHEKRGRVALLLAATALLLLALLSPRWLPYNMDEFVHYQPLGCGSAPASDRLSVYREGCRLYDLRLPFTTTPLPLRSYLYIGSLPVVVFYPFWKLLDDPVAVRLQGAVFFVLAIGLMARYLRTRPGSVVLASLVYPLFLGCFLSDQGPVGLSVLLLLGFLLLARGAALTAAPRRITVLAALAGLALFLGLWVKLVFAWWLPAALVLAAREVRTAALPRRRSLVLAAAATLAFAAPSALLLFARDGEGLPYYAAVSRARVSAAPATWLQAADHLGLYFLMGSRAVPRVLEWPTWPVDVLPAFLTAALLAWGLRRGAERRGEVATLTGLGLLTFALSLPSSFTQWPHHFVFSLIFVIMALAVASEGLRRARPRLFVAACLLAFAYWASFLARLPQAVAQPESGPDKDALLAFVRARGFDRQTIQVHTSWGTYYIAQLFGDPARAVVYLKSLSDDPRLLAEVRQVAEAEGRPVLLISARRWARLQTPAVAAALGPPLQTYRFGDWWAVVYLREVD
jgi:hypothetical protein